MASPRAEFRTARLVVQQLVNEVEDSAAFSFDFVMLCIMGSIIAACGLVTASPVIILAYVYWYCVI